MNAKVIISLFILAHVISDFLLQDDQLANKKKKNYKSLLKHSSIFWGTLFIVTFHYLSLKSPKLLLIQFILVLSHCIIDKSIIYLEKKTSNHILLFIMDQLLHLVIILSTYTFLKNIEINPIGEYLNNLSIELFPLFQNLNQQDWYIIILILAGYLFVWEAGSIITRITLNNIIYPQNEKIKIIETSNKAGSLIGKLERTLILTLVLSKSYASISLIFAAKSVARFKNFEDKDFIDYYIIGTFVSVITAILIGLILNLIVNTSGYQEQFIFYQIFS